MAKLLYPGALLEVEPEVEPRNNPYPDDGIGIDFFVSHNWHDENADQRWAALTELSDRFLDRYGRLPR